MQLLRFLTIMCWSCLRLILECPFCSYLPNSKVNGIKWSVKPAIMGIFTPQKWANTTNQSLFLQRVNFPAHYCLRLWVRPTTNFEVRERAEVGDMAMAGTIFIERFFPILLPECLPYSDFSLFGHKELSLHVFAARFSSCFQLLFYLFQDTRLRTHQGF